MSELEALTLYGRDIHHLPFLETDSQGREWQALVEGNLRLVLSVAHRYARRYNIDLLDLVQAGNLGLIRAAQDYDPQRATFSTHAMWWIQSYIRQCVAQELFLLSIPLEKVRFAFRVQKDQQDHPEASLEDIAQRLDASVEEIQACLRLTRGMMSLDQTTHDDDDESLVDRLEADATSDPEHLVLGLSHTRLLEDFLSILMPDERKVIIWRYGLDHQESLTQEAIARKLSTNRDYVRVLEKRALMKMRRHAQVYQIEQRTA